VSAVYVMFDGLLERRRARSRATATLTPAEAD
jgi:hypothetical protein